jgi:hypothetical protein
MLEMISRAAFEADVSRLDVAAVSRWGWEIVSAEYPVFDVIFHHPSAAALRLRLECEQWNELPPSIQLLRGDGTSVDAAPPSAGNIFHPCPHPVTGRLFVCMRGVREYHTHESHLAEAWSNYRGTSGNDLIGIVTQIYRSWKKAIG